MSEEKENKKTEDAEKNKGHENKAHEDKAQKNLSGENTTKDKKIISADKPKAKSGNKLLYFLIIILFIIISVACVFINDRINNIEQSINQNNIENNSTVEDSGAQIKEIFLRFTAVERKLEELESKQTDLSHLLSQPVEQQTYINEDYALAEIEHLLIIASYNLQLGHDVATALSAMESADARLTGMTDPAVLSVREQLITDMNELRSINQADLSGLGLFLSDLISRVDKLSLKENAVLGTLETNAEEKNTEPSEKQVDGIKHFFELVFKELKSLVVITRDKNVSKARLLPDELYFLKANLKLELANARFAVFNRDTANLHASIEHIQNWLNDYFDLSDAAVQNIYDSLSRMKKMELTFPDMDISSSLESVRALSRSQGEDHSVVDEEELAPLQ